MMCDRVVNCRIVPAHKWLIAYIFPRFIFPSKGLVSSSVHDYSSEGIRFKINEAIPQISISSLMKCYCWSERAWLVFFISLKLRRKLASEVIDIILIKWGKLKRKFWNYSLVIFARRIDLLNANVPPINLIISIAPS